ncbi:Gfo/Idh/MocA family oxidoreductase [Paenibacillus antri]|uniref:Gfo/Idh/MocA family oxidoreductase n=1 Tax=Paenibacillus antri TaxID=2582848 RepID=A0A5R9GBB3_9BACL|nr:Gfo/Idh/MocA family oxidoreductase [Paenibacillus antri]TLS51596.1 Gfo/Idh/MocA family oxidoreductase [Paenibacillus antri]
MSKVKVGIVGVGSIAHMCHLPGYRNNPHAEIVAIADTDVERAKRVASEFGNPAVYESAERMYREAGVDAVSICTFNDTHVSLALSALKYGIDVLVEKPMAVSLEEALQLKEAAAASRNVVMVGMSHRYRADAQALQGLAAGGELGEIYYAKAKILRRRGAPLGWFTQRLYSGGGPMMDIGVHALDLAWWMMGAPAPKQVLGKQFRKVAPYDTKYASFYEAHSDVNKVGPVYDVEDMGTAFITFDNGAALTIEASWAVNGSQDDALKVELFGTKGGASLDPLTVFKETNRIPVEYALKVPAADLYQAEVDAFVRCVRERERPLCDASQGYEVVKMLEAIRVSSDTDDLVRLA